MRILYSHRALHARIFGLWLLAMTLMALTSCSQTDPFNVNDTSIAAANDDVLTAVTWVTDTTGKPFVDQLRGQCPQAELSLERVTTTTGTLGGIASGQFSSTIGTITNVGVAINGATYSMGQILPTQPDSGRGNPFFGGGGRSGGSRRGLLFSYPLPVRGVTPTFIPLANTGMTAVFSVTGYTLSDNSIDVPNAVSISAPTAGSTVERSGTLTVNWGALGAGSTVFAVVRNAPTSLSGTRSQGGSQNRTSQVKPITKRTTDNSATTVTFTAAELQTLNAGNAVVEIMVVNTKSINNGNAILNARSAGRVNITLQ